MVHQGGLGPSGRDGVVATGRAAARTKALWEGEGPETHSQIIASEAHRRQNGGNTPFTLLRHPLGDVGHRRRCGPSSAMWAIVGDVEASTRRPAPRPAATRLVRLLDDG